MSAPGWRATHRLVHRVSGTPADDLMEFMPGAYVTESEWKRYARLLKPLENEAPPNLMVVTPGILPSFDFVPVLVGR
jgi:hypothetical protein